MGGYIGSSVGNVANAAERKQTYSITTATTSLTGLAYTPTKVHVFHNGVRLVDSTDYTATNGTSITLTNAAQNGDEVVVISYPSFQTSDTVSAANGGTFAGNVAMSGTLDVTGNSTVGGTLVNTGLITASAGVAIGGTSSPNTLDDYEEGVHQTAITMSSSGTVTLNTSYDSLSYTKVGRLVTITGHPRIASVSSPVGSMYLSLPFTAKNGQQDESRSGGVLNYYDNSGGSGSYYKLLSIQINQNSNLLGINNTHTHNFNLTPAASDEIYLNFCYITD